MTRAASAMTEPSPMRSPRVSASVESREPARGPASPAAALFEHIGIGLASGDARGMLVQVNPAFRSVLGLAANFELIGTKLDALADGDQAVALDTLLSELQAGERTSARLDLRRELADERIVWVDLQIDAIRDAGNTCVGLAISATDFTEHVQRAALNKQSQMLAMQNAGLGLWRWDLARNEVIFDTLWAMALGCAVSELPAVSETWNERIHPDDWPQVEASLLATLKGDTAEFAIEHRMRHKEGHWIWLFTTGTVTHRSPERRALHMIGTSQDITQRKTAEAALVMSQVRQTLALQSAGLGQWERHVPSDTVSFDARACEMFGYALGELESHVSVWQRISFPEDVAAIRLSLEPMLRGEVDEYRIVRRRRHKLGHTVWVLDNGRVVERDANRRAVRMVGLYQDISEQIQLEATLREAKEAADAASHSKGEFLANMSHEIRTPMNAIIGLTRLVLDTEMNSRQRDYLTKVHSASKALLGILNDVLDYSKIEAGRMELEHIQFSIEEPLNSVANLFGAQLEQKGLELFFEMAPDVPTEVIGDPMRLTQVLNNLVGNAIKFTEKGEIRIKVELGTSSEDECTLRVGVSDTGIGLSKAQAARLFQAFTQADNSVTRKYGGTGLGLTISQKLVALMQGEITVSSVEGQGCTFSFTFQVRRPAIAQHGRDLQRLRGLRALVVDDQDTSRLIMETMFGTWGMTVETTPSPIDGLAKVRDNQERGTPFDVVLLDWRMPEMNGLEMARAMRAQTGPGQCPPFAIMVTAFGREQLLNEAGDIALDVVLAKPVVPSALFDILTRLQQPSGEPVVITPHHVSAPVAVRFDGARILLAEDNFLNQEVACEFLSSYGAVVSVVGDGAQALNLAQQQTFDMILMDLHMPVMDGVESARAIRALPGCENVPIVAMTAAVMSEDRGRCEAAGMVDFVAKPVDPDDLVRALRRWLPALGSQPASGGAAVGTANKSRSRPNSGLYSIKLTGFEPSAALRRLRGNEERLTQLLRAFCVQQQDALAKLRSALAMDDRDNALQQLHSVKGVAGTLGLMSLADAANALEAQINAGRLPADESAFANAMVQSLTALAELAPAPAEPVAAVAEVLAPLSDADRQTLQRILTDLLRYARDQELVPDDLIDEFKRCCAGALPAQRVSLLCQHLFDFDHESALADLQQLGATLDLAVAT